MILLYNQSTLDLIFSKIFTSEVKKSKTNLEVEGKVETLLIKHRSKIPGYDQTMWCRKRVIVNIVSLNNTNNQYIVTHGCTNETFVVHSK